MSSNVEFEEDKFGANASKGQNLPKQFSSSQSGGNSAMVNWLMEHKLAKNSKGANTILIAVCVIDIIAAIVIYNIFF